MPFRASFLYKKFTPIKGFYIKSYFLPNPRITTFAFLQKSSNIPQTNNSGGIYCDTFIWTSCVDTIFKLLYK